jgi:hypothetical protein
MLTCTLFDLTLVENIKTGGGIPLFRLRYATILDGEGLALLPLLNKLEKQGSV